MKDVAVLSYDSKGHLRDNRHDATDSGIRYGSDRAVQSRGYM